MSYTEDSLVQQTTANYLEQKPGWDSVYAFNEEDFGPGSLLGRKSDKEVVLTRDLLEKLKECNPGLRFQAYEAPVRHLTDVMASHSSDAICFGMVVEYVVKAVYTTEKRLICRL